MNPASALRAIRVRPVAICIPLATEANRKYARLVGNVSVGMSCAFFETVFDFASRLCAAASGHPDFKDIRPPRGFSRN